MSKKIWTIVGVIAAALLIGALISIPIVNAIINAQKARITREKMERAFQELVLVHAEEAQAYPDEKVTRRRIRMDPSGIGYDAWTNRIVYKDRRRFFELRSLGPDKKAGTKDDIVVTSREYPASFGPYNKKKDSK